MTEIELLKRELIKLRDIVKMHSRMLEIVKGCYENTEKTLMIHHQALEDITMHKLPKRKNN